MKAGRLTKKLCEMLGLLRRLPSGQIELCT
jgi:hypothetical protein